jgi:hypothetical protein
MPECIVDRGQGQSRQCKWGSGRLKSQEVMTSGHPGPFRGCFRLLLDGVVCASFRESSLMVLQSLLSGYWTRGHRHEVPLQIGNIASV